ncbi:MAG: redoxin domain-containing protein [Tepidisphaeraceae bacterium]
MTALRTCLVALALLTCSALRAAEKFEPKTLEIGSAAPDFALKGVDDKDYTLGDFKDAKVLVIVFTTNHCPTANAYEQRIIDLHKDYATKAVAVVAINPNDPKAVRLDELGYTDLQDDFESMKLRAKERSFAFPYLYDGDAQAAAKSYGCQATPHVFIFDQERKLRYTGRIDDGEVKPPTSHDARNAIDALLAGKPVPVEKTKVFGCSTKWSYKQGDVKGYFAKVDAEPVELSDIDAAGIKALAKNADSNKLRVINVWATWCAPCVAELPEFVTMNRMYRKRDFEFITISMDEVDRKDRALAQLKELHASGKNYILKVDGDRDAAMTSLDEKWEGPLPHTIVVAPGGKILYRNTGGIDPLELKRVIVGYLGRTYATKK